MKTSAALTLFAAGCLGMAASPQAGTAASSSPKGLLFYAKYPHQADTSALGNPHLAGALFQIYWSEIEKTRGAFDWSGLEAWIEPWKKAGRKVGLRILWSTSGYWPDPAAKRPTPAWVWETGAAKVTHQPSGTEIPLFWDPIYRRHAIAFLRETARRFDGDSIVLFLDMTPGAETNPYRFGTLNDRDTAFPSEFLAARASDGRSYDPDTWVDAVGTFVDSAASIFSATPLLVTLNAGGMPGSPGRQREIGDHCVAAGAWVGQNGLTGGSYASQSQARTNFLDWSARSPVFFETLSSTADERMGTLLDVMRAAERAGFHFLNLYPSDVRKGTPGHPDYRPEYEEALRYGKRLLLGPTGPASAPQGRKDALPGAAWGGVDDPGAIQDGGADILGRVLPRGGTR